MNSGVFSGYGGALRLLTIMIGIVDIGITVDAYLHHYTSEEFFLSVIVISLIISCVLAMLGFLQLGKLHRVDFVFHVLVTPLLLVGGILMLVSVFRFGYTHSRWYYTERISCGVIGIVNSVVYGNLAWILMNY